MAWAAGRLCPCGKPKPVGHNHRGDPADDPETTVVMRRIDPAHRSEGEHTFSAFHLAPSHVTGQRRRYPRMDTQEPHADQLGDNPEFRARVQWPSGWTRAGSLPAGRKEPPVRIELFYRSWSGGSTRHSRRSERLTSYAPCCSVDSVCSQTVATRYRPLWRNRPLRRNPPLWRYRPLWRIRAGVTSCSKEALRVDKALSLACSTVEAAAGSSDGSGSITMRACS
jgi:hypothetical protein